jgi:hypothetical protein
VVAVKKDLPIHATIDALAPLETSINYLLKNSEEQYHLAARVFRKGNTLDNYIIKNLMSFLLGRLPIIDCHSEHLEKWKTVLNATPEQHEKIKELEEKLHRVIELNYDILGLAKKDSEEEEEEAEY